MKNPYDAIEAYYNDRLTQEEKQDFEAEMAGDPGLKEAVEEYPKIAPFLDLLLEEDIRSSLDKIKMKSGQSTPKQKKEPQARRRNLVFPLSIAAGMLLLFMVAMWIWTGPSTHPSELFDEYYKYPMTETTRGEQEVPVDLDFAQYMEAHKLLRESSVERSEAAFLHIARETDSKYRQRAEWFSVLTALKQEEIKVARERLELILEDEHHEYHAKAEELAVDLK